MSAVLSNQFNTEIALALASAQQTLTVLDQMGATVHATVIQDRREASGSWRPVFLIDPPPGGIPGAVRERRESRGWLFVAIVAGCRVEYVAPWLRAVGGAA